MKVQLVQITPDAERLIIYCARVSNPKNQNNSQIEKLLKYCLDKNHWSIFEQAHMTLEIETSRAIAAQILRHKSFSFQEFSTRYSSPEELGEEGGLPLQGSPLVSLRENEDTLGEVASPRVSVRLFEPIELRQQAAANRQSSAEIIENPEISKAIQSFLELAQTLYLELLETGVAKECARFVLPMTLKTRLYMTGNIRSWIHYLQLRSQEDTQKEHREVAIAAKEIFKQQLPIISSALWGEEND